MYGFLLQRGRGVWKSGKLRTYYVDVPLVFEYHQISLIFLSSSFLQISNFILSPWDCNSKLLFLKKKFPQVSRWIVCWFWKKNENFEWFRCCRVLGFKIIQCFVDHSIQEFQYSEPKMFLNYFQPRFLGSSPTVK